MKVEKEHIAWNASFAYGVGLIASDGSLSKDGRHIVFTSKDHELVRHFRNCFCVKCPVKRKARGGETRKRYYYAQFSDVRLYRIFLAIGLHPNKSKTLSSLLIPEAYFADFLRGYFDGDGSFYSYFDPRWKSSFMFYTVFITASQKFVLWLRWMIYRLLRIKGHITKDGKRTAYHLKYAKKESLRLLRKLYSRKDVMCLQRKRLKVQKALGINGMRLF